jgi:threonine/homoserine/homoserine lactone efflux protein
MLDYSLAHWLTFFSAAFILTLSPGPDLAFILAQTVKGGCQSGFAAMLGIWGGTVAHILLAIIGLSAMINASTLAFAMVKWGGVLYLIWLGLSAFRASEPSLSQTHPMADAGKANFGIIFGQGFVITLLNPKVAIFFLSFLPLFVAPDAGPVWMQLALHGALLIVVAAMVEPLWILLGERLAAKLRHAPRFVPWLNRGMGAVLIALGIRLAFETK